MSITLEKGARIDLTKTNAGLVNLHFGLGWDAATGLVGSLRNLLSGTTGGSIDLDASAIVLDVHKNPLETVYFGKLSGQGIRHSGDNRTGAGDGDDEIINVNLATLDHRAAYVVFVINSYSGQTFSNVANATCRILNKDTQQVLATYNLTAKGNHTAIVVGSLYKQGNDWKFRAIGELADGRTVHDITSLASQVG